MTLDIAQQNASVYDSATNGFSFYNDNMNFPSNFYLSPFYLSQFSFHFSPTLSGKMDFWNNHLDYQNDLDHVHAHDHGHDNNLVLDT